jgi:amidase
MCAAAIGTETDGSIVCPSGNQLIVGLKPTVGLIPARGIIPIAHSQDSAGPMTRDVTDLAILMNILASASLDGHPRPPDYTRFLRRDALRHARIGIERRLFRPEFFALPEIVVVVEEAIEAMRRAGATIVDPVDTGNPFAWNEAEFTVLLFEFKHDIEEYLSTLRHTSMRTLGDLIRFNNEHCEQEMKFFGQEIFLLAEETGGDLSSPTYRRARKLCLQLGREKGINRVVREHNLDAVLSPSYGFGSSAPAIAGFPVMSVPVGFTADGKPAGVWLYAGFMQEPQLIAVGFGIEQLLHAHEPPHFAGHVPPPLPDAGICRTTVAERMRERPRMVMHMGRGHMFPGR